MQHRTQVVASCGSVRPIRTRSWTTAEPAPMTLSSPMLTPGPTMTQPPRHTLFPMLIGGLLRACRGAAADQWGGSVSAAGRSARSGSPPYGDRSSQTLTPHAVTGRAAVRPGTGPPPTHARSCTVTWYPSGSANVNVRPNGPSIELETMRCPSASRASCIACTSVRCGPPTPPRPATANHPGGGGRDRPRRSAPAGRRGSSGRRRRSRPRPAPGQRSRHARDTVTDPL